MSKFNLKLIYFVKLYLFFGRVTIKIWKKKVKIDEKNRNFIEGWFRFLSRKKIIRKK